VIDISGWLSGSPDGRYHVVGTPEGQVVLDSADWRRLRDAAFAGPIQASEPAAPPSAGAR